MANDNPTIPHAPAGYNCLMVVQKYGSRVAMVTDISYALNIGSSEDEAASRRVYYPLNQYIPAFDISYVFKSRVERDAFNQWMQAYMQKAASNQNIGGYVYVQIPARNIAFNGVPLGPLVYGEAVPTTPSYPLSVRYVGVTNPTSAIGKTALAGVSQFQLPTKDTKDAPYFYPAGKQKAGAETLEGTLYDPTPPRTVPPVGGGGGGGNPPRGSAW
jgi:hypothetical protein